MNSNRILKSEYIKQGWMYFALIFLRLFGNISLEEALSFKFGFCVIAMPIILECFYFAYSGVGLTEFEVINGTFILAAMLIVVLAFLCVVVYLFTLAAALHEYLYKRMITMEKAFDGSLNVEKSRKFCMKMKNASNKIPQYAWPFVSVVGVVVLLLAADGYSGNWSVGIKIGIGIIMVEGGVFLRRKTDKYSDDTFKYVEYEVEEKTVEEPVYNGTHLPIRAGYFNGCTEIADVKKIYKSLVKEFHPDNGGDVYQYEMLNKEYEHILEIWNEK